jgi:hypothetical protein
MAAKLHPAVALYRREKRERQRRARPQLLAAKRSFDQLMAEWSAARGANTKNKTRLRRVLS